MIIIMIDMTTTTMMNNGDTHTQSEEEKFISFFVHLELLNSMKHETKINGRNEKFRYHWLFGRKA